jgi:hypothetical protein
MFQKINAHILILLFIALFSYESVEYFCGQSFEHHETISGILELEEEGGTSEESKEEKDEEIKFEDNFFIENNKFHCELLLEHSMVLLNQHYKASDYSAQVYSPPDYI